MSEDFRSWLETNGLGKYAATLSTQNIDFDVLPDLTAQDLKEIGLPLGDRKRMLRAIATLSSEQPQTTGPESAPVYRRDPEAEPDRRQLTVMFCDLVGSTALSTRFDPEDLHEIITEYQRACTSVIEQYGGYIARFMGDGILVYFGYPRADELAPERAVQAGLEITKVVPGLKVKDDLKLHVRVAIATGKVLVGEQVGEGGSLEYTVLGEAPNLAARLQSVADPDSVVIAHATRELIGELFSFTDLGPRSVKGLDNEVRVWTVGRELPVESRFEAKRRGLEFAPLIGREDDLAGLMANWADARKGDGQAVLLRGEGGIGKSRLAQALRERVEPEPHNLLRYFCVPYRNNSVLFPVITQLERAAGFESDDSAELRLDKLESLLARSGETYVEAAASLFADLLSIPSNGRYPPITLSPERRMQDTLAALESQLFSLAEQLPVLVIFEDVHWADATTLDLLQGTIQRLRGRSVLMIITARPEFALTVNGSVPVRTIDLDRFGRDTGESLILGVTGGKALPKKVLSLILEKTDGVPLFIEEFTRAVINSELLTEGDDSYELTGSLPDHLVPNTLQDSLMARLDRNALAKRVAQVGSVIGRRFSWDLLARIADINTETLREALDELQQMSLLLSQDSASSVQYLFKHALIRDAAYSSLPRRRRKGLHARIGLELERSFPDIATTEPELLAHHYALAEDKRRAITLWLQAGRNASRQAAHTTALQHFRSALDLLKDLPEGVERNGMELSLLVAQGVSLASTQGYATPDVQANYDRAERLCGLSGDASETFGVTRNVCTYYIVRAEFKQARDLAQRCVAVAEQDEDPSYLTEAYTALGYVESFRGLYAEGSRFLGACLDVYRQNRGQIIPLTPQDPGVACGALRAIVLWFMGRTVEAREELTAALQLATELKHPLHLAYVHTYCAMLAELDGDAEAAHAHALESVNLSTDHGLELWRAVGMIHLGHAMALLDEVNEAISTIETGIGLYESTGARSFMPYYLFELSEAYRRSGQIDSALATIDRAISHAEGFDERMYDGLLYRLRGEIIAAIPSTSPEAARADVRRAIEISKEAGARQLELEAVLAFQRLEPGTMDPIASRDALAELVATFDENARSRFLDEGRLQLAGAGA